MGFNAIPEIVQKEVLWLETITHQAFDRVSDL
jgi:hypothetical protein